MGFEYKFRVTRQDFLPDPRVTGTDPMDALLTNLPGYIRRDETTYYFNNPNGTSTGWDANVLVCPEELLLCIYCRETWGTELMTALMFALLDRCGRLEVEDA